MGPRLDTSFLATLIWHHKTNKRNPIIEKEVKEHAIALSHIPYQAIYNMKIIVLLSVLPIATAVGPFVPFPHEPFGIYKQRQWVDLCFGIWYGLVYRWNVTLLSWRAHISRLSRSEINVVRVDQSRQFSFMSFIYCRYHIKRRSKPLLTWLLSCNLLQIKCRRSRRDEKGHPN